jgi:SAM-dependent methyltransferase
MKENKYDDDIFFEKYGKMPRSTNGLEAAGEWSYLRNILPDFKNKRVLDLGCGYGWHCRYAIEKNAKFVVGVDISEKMLKKATLMTIEKKIQYLHKPLEDLDFNKGSFDIIISSLAFHYIYQYVDLIKKIYMWLNKKGVFVFSVEHPIFTAYGSQNWIYSEEGEIIHWPVDNYFHEGKREAIFLGEKITKYHRTLTTYLNTLIKEGFKIIDIIEPKPSKNTKEMENELRRPMMLLVGAIKE